MRMYIYYLSTTVQTVITFIVLKRKQGRPTIDNVKVQWGRKSYICPTVTDVVRD